MLNMQLAVVVVNSMYIQYFVKENKNSEDLFVGHFETPISDSWMATPSTHGVGS